MVATMRMCTLIFNITRDSGRMLSDIKSVFPHRYALAGQRYCLPLCCGARLGHRVRTANGWRTLRTKKIASGGIHVRRI